VKYLFCVDDELAERLMVMKVKSSDTLFPQINYSENLLARPLNAQ